MVSFILGDGYPIKDNIAVNKEICINLMNKQICFLKKQHKNLWTDNSVINVIDVFIEYC